LIPVNNHIDPADQVGYAKDLAAAARGYTMKAVRITGTENYAEEAPELLKRYERRACRLPISIVP
jgi:hypothetical protein